MYVLYIFFLEAGEQHRNTRKTTTGKKHRLSEVCFHSF